MAIETESHFIGTMHIFLTTAFASFLWLCVGACALADESAKARLAFGSPVKVEGKRFMQDGHEVTLNGLNYFPAYFPLSFPRSWLSAGLYRAEMIKDDLTTLHNLGVNLVSVSGLTAGATPTAEECANVRDFLDQARSQFILVNMYVGSGSVIPVADPARLAVVPKVCALAGHPALFAYDIAWEPHFGGASDRRKLQARWLNWLEQSYGTLTAADSAFDGNHELPTDEEFCGEEPLVRVAAFRRFLDDVVSASYRDIRAALRAVDTTHLIGARSGHGGNGSRQLCKNAAVDLRAGAKHLDFVSPEAYALPPTNSSELMHRGQFTAAYADVGKPVFWAEFGSNVDGSCAHCNEDIQERFFSDIFEMMRRTASNGGAGWWFVGVRPQTSTDTEKSDFGIIYDYLKYPSAMDAFGAPLRDGWLSLCTSDPAAHRIQVAEDERTSKQYACPDGLKPRGRFKPDMGRPGVATAKAADGKSISAGWMMLCSSDDSIVLAVSHDDKSNEDFQCPVGHTPAGSFKPDALANGKESAATDAFGRTISSGWLTLCARNSAGLLKRTRNEMSGRNTNCPSGLINAGSFKPDVLPVFRPVARLLKGALSGLSARNREYSSWINVDRDQVAGDWRMYSNGTQAIAAIAREDGGVGARTACAGTTSREARLCIGNTINSGSCPPKCLNAEWNSIQILNAVGEWQTVRNQDSVTVTAGKPVQSRLVAGNTGEGVWLALGSDAGVVGKVSFGCNEHQGDIGCRRTITNDVDLFMDTASGDFIITPGVTKRTRVAFQMVAEGVAWFGERTTVLLQPR